MQEAKTKGFHVGLNDKEFWETFIPSHGGYKNDH